MGLYRAKPVIVEAYQFDGRANGAKQIQAAIPSHRIEVEIKTIACLFPEPGWSPPATLSIRGFTAVKDDWIVRDNTDRLTICKPDIFALTYDVLEVGD